MEETKWGREGNRRKLVQIVRRMLRRGNTAEAIAGELGEDSRGIERICEAALGFAPEYEVDKIYEQISQ